MPTAGVRKRHGRSCASRDGRDCNCTPSWEARVWSRRAGPDGKGGTISKSFPTYAAAKGWREDASHANRRGKLRPATRKTVREALVELLDGVKAGQIRSARRKPYRPSTVRSYERATGLFPEMRERAPSGCAAHRAHRGRRAPRGRRGRSTSGGSCESSRQPRSPPLAASGAQGPTAPAGTP